MVIIQIELTFKDPTCIEQAGPFGENDVEWLSHEVLDITGWRYLTIVGDCHFFLLPAIAGIVVVSAIIIMAAITLFIIVFIIFIF